MELVKDFGAQVKINSLRNEHINIFATEVKVVIIINLGQRQKSA